MLNKVMLVGRTTRDVEAHKTATEKNVAIIGLAVNRNFKNPSTGNYETDFFDCTAFGTTADFITKYVPKGALISISGSLRNERWTTPNGENRSKVGIIIEEVQLISRANNNGQASDSSTSLSQKGDKKTDRINRSEDDELPEDLPF